MLTKEEMIKAGIDLPTDYDYKCNLYLINKCHLFTDDEFNSLPDDLKKLLIDKIIDNNILIYFDEHKAIMDYGICYDKERFANSRFRSASKNNYDLFDRRLFNSRLFDIMNEEDQILFIKYNIDRRRFLPMEWLKLFKDKAIDYYFSIRYKHKDISLLGHGVGIIKEEFDIFRGDKKKLIEDILNGQFQTTTLGRIRIEDDILKEFDIEYQKEIVKKFISNKNADIQNISTYKISLLDMNGQFKVSKKFFDIYH